MTVIMSWKLFSYIIIALLAEVRVNSCADLGTRFDALAYFYAVFHI